MRRFLLVLPVDRGGGLRLERRRLPDHLDQHRLGPHASAERQGRGPAHLHRGRQARSRARLGRGERRRRRSPAPARSPSSSTTPAATRSTSCTTGRPRRSPASTTRSRARRATCTSPVVKKLRAGAADRGLLLEARVPRRLRPLRRPGARVEGRGVQGARRQLLGRPVVAAQASELRPRLESVEQRLGGPPLALDGRAAGADHQHRLVLAPVEPPLRDVHLQRRAGLRPRTRPRPGQPLDSFGRNLYLDTLDSAYGTGWKRENSFLTHKGDGVFCYSVNPHPGHPAGHGGRVPRDDHGPRRHARRDVAGPGPGRVRQGRQTLSATSRSRACTTPSAARTSSGRPRHGV